MFFLAEWALLTQSHKHIQSKNLTLTWTATKCDLLLKIREL